MKFIFRCRIFSLLIAKIYICHLLFVLLFEKKTVTNIDRKKQKRYTHLKKRGESNRHRDIQKTKKIKLWIMIIPMMDMENRQTFNKKRHRHTYIHIKSNSKRLCSRVKKKMLIHILFSESSKTTMMILFCEEDIHTHTHIHKIG
jgi:hypothetical protein